MIYYIIILTYVYIICNHINYIRGQKIYSILFLRRKSIYIYNYKHIDNNRLYHVNIQFTYNIIYTILYIIQFTYNMILNKKSYDNLNLLCMCIISVMFIIRYIIIISI